MQTLSELSHIHPWIFWIGVVYFYLTIGTIIAALIRKLGFFGDLSKENREAAVVFSVTLWPFSFLFYFLRFLYCLIKDGDLREV